ncbi:uncharacterized protein YqkB [Pullulanibacillus pueri]|uniref:Core domain-containing protein n=1 Tax=Pullulanibacillus pueri TaxID=1437324 RepID=A0A8J2ZUG7_9BACL|nr:iron-sulfur cluster biosynthesis family protein [Pullulanibacillus pueri]MBM7681166.1 uncharacterized protein YqkB [Pullulanibacillus pueri]GGH77305.1 hypothetical protein GCM10007096_09010 [Pullulanibacillus pueri]
MKIQITEKAQQILDHYHTEQGILKLHYETEGCGCAVSGVNELWLVEHAAPEDIEIVTNAQPVYVEMAKQVFLDEALTIDYSEQTKMFMLKSPQQILTPRMTFTNKITIN